MAYISLNISSVDSTQALSQSSYKTTISNFNKAEIDVYSLSDVLAVRSA